MNFPLIVRTDSPDHFVAQPLGLPELTTAGSTEAEAVARASQALTEWFESAKVIQVSVPVPVSGNPWIDYFGRSANDPDFDEYLAEIKRARDADEVE
jgi:predicted RNase H-like HicB family nuclease